MHNLPGYGFTKRFNYLKVVFFMLLNQHSCGFYSISEHSQPVCPLQEIVGGMMDLEPRLWRKLIKENFDDQRKKVLQFAQWWKPYDCTKTEG